MTVRRFFILSSLLAALSCAFGKPMGLPGPPDTFVIGTTDITTQPDYSGAFIEPVKAITVGTKLIVSDSNNYRVLIWNTIPTTTLQPADVVIGESSFSTVATQSAASASTFGAPWGLASDGTKLIVSDFSYNRILIWNTIPTTNGASADVVIGQADFTSSSANEGSTATAQSLYQPTGIFVNASKLYVADQLNHRVLIYNTIPTSNHASANVVLGQADKTSSSANAGGSAADNTLDGPSDVLVAAGSLFVADTTNQRVLMWNTLPTSDQTSANVVIGQPDMTTVSSDTSSTKMNNPSALASDGTKLAVADQSNNRVLIYTTIPSASGAAANVVLGQPNMSTGTSSVSSQGLYSPTGIWIADSKIYVGDMLNNRVLVWNSIPTSNQTAADIVLGQAAMNRKESNQTQLGIGANTVLGPTRVFYDGTRLFIADTLNHRVLIYNSMPTDSNASADIVLGQTSLTAGGANAGSTTSASSLESPSDIFSTGTQLYVADSGNNRVLIWNSIPTTNGQAADLVVGQSDKVSSGSARTSTGLNGPNGVFVTGTKLIVSDNGNHRVLIWNTLPAADGATASVVLGAPDMTSAASGVNSEDFVPNSVSSDGTKLFVADNTHYRILVWNAIPSATNEVAADFALGQIDTSTVSAPASTSLTSVRLPQYVLWSGTQLFVSDGDNRVLIWDSLTGSSGQAADHYFGEPTATANTAGTPSATTLNGPQGITISGTKMVIADTTNQRILVTPISSAQ